MREGKFFVPTCNKVPLCCVKGTAQSAMRNYELRITNYELRINLYGSEQFH